MSNTYKLTMALAVIFLLSTGSPSTLAATDISKGVTHPGFNKAMTSIAVIDTSNGKTIVNYSPDLKLNPASCSKIFTSASALTLLGANHRFRTHFYADHSPLKGTIGTLYVVGEGDPTLVNEELAQIASHLVKKGIRRITGGIVIDNSYFDSYEYPHKYTGKGRAYTAKTSATAVNFNSLTIKVGPGAKIGAPGIVMLDPPSDAWRIVNKTVTGGKFRVAINFGQDKGEEILIVTGRIPPKFEPQDFFRSVKDPVRHSGAIITYWLKQADINVSGPIREGVVPSTAVGIMSWESRPLADVMAMMNKVSNNFIAEQTLKHLGATLFGEPGSTNKGLSAIERYLTSIGIPKDSYSIENGSGLSAITRVSAHQIVQVLEATYKNSKIRDAFMSSLSVLGVDGTTKKWRFAGDLEGRILVKTGTLDGVSTLAGYAPLPGGRIAAFAILANAVPHGAWKAHEAQLGIVRAIMEVQQ